MSEAAEPNVYGEPAAAGEVYVRAWFLSGSRTWGAGWGSEEFGPMSEVHEFETVEFEGGVPVKTEFGPPKGPDVLGAGRGRLLAYGRVTVKGDTLLVTA